jgi:hypothetical protein
MQILIGEQMKTNNITLEFSTGKMTAKLIDSNTYLLALRESMVVGVKIKAIRIPLDNLKPGRYVLTIGPEHEFEIIEDDDEGG